MQRSASSHLGALGLLLLSFGSWTWASTSVVSASALPQPVQQDSNLLENPGFEPPYTQHAGDMSVAQGWMPWWVTPGSSPAYPISCNYNVDPPSCQPYKQPIFQSGDQPHGGGSDQKYFTAAAIHLAGVYQQVTGVAPGQPFRFTVYVRTFSSNSAGTTSAGQPSMGAQTGIDPEGGTDPFSRAVVWSQAQNAFDTWTPISVDAAARSSTITVYTRTWPQLALARNEVYLDDASLSPISGLTVATSLPFGDTALPDITQAPTATLFSTSTPLPNGEVWYTVQPGDTLGRIAHLTNTKVEDLKSLNSLKNNFIIAGQKLLVAIVTPSPTVTPFQPPTETPTATSTLVEPPTIPALVTAQNPANYGQLCVVAYNDANRNATNDKEPSVADVRVTLSVGGTPLEGYVTTGTEASHCFPQLLAGSYLVTVTPPTGYESTTAAEATVQLQAGNLVTLAFGLARVASATQPTPTATPVPDANSTSLTVFLAGMTGLTVFIGVLGVVMFLWLKKK